jgi:hypothetical protein
VLETLPVTKHEIEQLPDLVANRHLTKDREIMNASRNNNGECKFLDKVVPNSKYKEKIFLTHKAMRKAIISLKSTLLLFDDIPKDVKDE